DIGLQWTFIASGRVLLFSFGWWGDETAVCLPFGRAILGGRRLALLLLLRRIGRAGVRQIGSETGVVSALAFFRSDQLCLLLDRRELHLHVALLRLRAGLARNTGHGNPGRPVGRGRGPLRGRRGRKRRVSHCSGGHCCLLFFLTFRLKLVFQLLHVAVGVVLQGGLRWLAFRAGLLRGGLLAGRTEERRHNHQQYRAQINEGLEVFLQDTFR